ncbi:78_t:CDS:2 [Gigaspora rosea]|nr:78_t:CDS:2 [Gigaspora rosea]
MKLDVEFENNQDLKSSLAINDFNLSNNPAIDFNNRQIQGFERLVRKFSNYIKTMLLIC